MWPGSSQLLAWMVQLCGQAVACLDGCVARGLVSCLGGEARV